MELCGENVGAVTPWPRKEAFHGCCLGVAPGPVLTCVHVYPLARDRLSHPVRRGQSKGDLARAYQSRLVHCCKQKEPNPDASFLGLCREGSLLDVPSPQSQMRG